MFEYDVLESQDFEIKKKDTKTFYNTDDVDTMKDWYKDESGQSVEFPGGTNELNVVQNHKSNIRDNSLGYFYSDSNSVEKNTTNVGLFTMGFSHGQGNSITKDNFTKVTSSFSARRLIVPSWENMRDEYLRPNDAHENFEVFSYDSIVYSLFNNNSKMSSLRQIEYKDKLWDIKNEFFWLSVDKMKELADQEGFSDLYFDAKTDSNRHVHNLLFGEERIYDKLSPDAKLVLDKATELVEKSMRMRHLMADGENHLKAWDAGYAQLKLVWKEYHSDEFKEFRALYKALEERMRPLVYELGFLLK